MDKDNLSRIMRQVKVVSGDADHSRQAPAAAARAGFQHGPDRGSHQIRPRFDGEPAQAHQFGLFRAAFADQLGAPGHPAAGAKAAAAARHHHVP
ncbi:MAG: hypothetical protein M0C28_37495 [Candidatus Moduliflexus flocculans]|nr:hypothetical protein [Candidatus Moduliflexus flocculans]